ncbi:MAG: WYL domain-containing protein [Actinomycetota bacterium]|nr:WYL domain-containing protein [Actinomycetota bacterium]MDQ3781563.1 WYL domain-containing protein [Actinomycetota bacterium]
MTTTPALPIAWAPLEAALRQRRPVRLSYHGKQRLVCPHALGWINARPMLLAYQTSGETTTGTLPADPRKRWRCLFVDEVDHVGPAGPANAWGTADNYNPAHPFPVIDEVAVAIVPDAPQEPLR